MIIKNNGYHGMFAWELSGDTDDYELVSSMYENKWDWTFKY